MCTVDPDLKAEPLIEHVLKPEFIDKAVAVLATLQWDKGAAPPIITLDRIVHAVRDMPDASGQGLHVAADDMEYLTIDTNKSSEPNNGWTQLVLEMFGAGARQLMRRTAKFENLLAVPIGLQ